MTSEALQASFCFFFCVSRGNVGLFTPPHLLTAAVTANSYYFTFKTSQKRAALLIKPCENTPLAADLTCVTHHFYHLLMQIINPADTLMEKFSCKSNRNLFSQILKMTSTIVLPISFKENSSFHFEAVTVTKSASHICKCWRLYASCFSVSSSFVALIWSLSHLRSFLLIYGAETFCWLIEGIIISKLFDNCSSFQPHFKQTLLCLLEMKHTSYWKKDKWQFIFCWFALAPFQVFVSGKINTV